MSDKKNFCSIHHFYYNGGVCPLCEKERIDRMVDLYGPKEEQTIKEEKVKDREINEDDLARLVNKFNVK